MDKKQDHKRKADETPVAEKAKILKSLLNEDVNARDADGYTILHWACIADQYEIAALLIERGADINARDATGKTLLHLAIGRNYQNIAALLIDKGANINVRDHNGMTYVDYACLKGCDNGINIVQLLIENGADIDSRYAHDRDILSKYADTIASCIYFDLLHKARRLINGGRDINDPINMEGDTLLHQACISGRPDVAKLLIDNGADIHVENIYGYTPLKLACDHKSPEIVRLLIKSGADIDVQDCLGQTPLQFAFNEKLYDIATLLIKKGAAINEKDSGGLAPIHWACLRNQSDIAALLIEKSAYINDPDDAGRTPLHWAAGRNYQNITQLLIDNDADINAQDNEGRTPLHWAMGLNYQNIAQLLIAKGADINAQEANGRTPLHWACIKDQYDIAELLIENDANINARDSRGLTPLDLALERDHQDIGKLLIERGADMNDIIVLNSPWPDVDPMTSLNIYMSDIESLDSFAPQNHLRVLAKIVFESLKEARSKLEKDQSLTLGNVNILSRFKDVKMPEKLLPQKTKTKFEFCTNTDATKDALDHLIPPVKHKKKIVFSKNIKDLIISFLVDTTDNYAIAKNSTYNINFTTSFFSRVENIAETLRAKGVITGGAKLEDVPGDGNCFFHAVSRLITGADHQTLRAIASRNIYDHQDQYREFVDGEETIEQYIIRNTQANTWADHLMIQSLADSLSNYRFEIIRSDGGRNIIEPRNIEEGSNLTTLILYYTGNHYMAIVQGPETIRAPVIVAEDSEQAVPVVEIVSDYANDTGIDVHIAGDSGEINSATSYSEII